MRTSKKRIALGVLLALAALVVVLNWTWGRLPGEPERTGRMMRVGDTDVRVLESNPTRPGPAVVMIHGLPGTAQDFEVVQPRLAGRRTIAYDRPGFGFSSGGFHPMDEQLTTLHRLLDRLGVERPILVGHSYGGTVSLAYAARYPGEVRGLVLIDAAAGGHEESALANAQARLVQVLSWPIVEPLADVTFSQLLRTVTAKQGDAAAFDPDEVDERHEEHLLSLNMRQEDLDAFAGEVLEGDDVIPALNRRLATIETPAIVIQGARDKLVEPERGREIAAQLPNAKLVMVSGGHMAPYVHPDVVVAAVRELMPRWLIPRDSWMRRARWADAGQRAMSKAMPVASARRRVAAGADQRARRAARSWNQPSRPRPRRGQARARSAAR